MSTAPVLFQADYVEPRSRLTTFFRIVLVIPHAIALWFYSIAAWVAVVIAWFAVVILGRWPRGLYDFLAGYSRYSTAVTGYLYLLTDVYPPFATDTSAYPVRLVFGEPKERYSRLKAFFRLVLAIPVFAIAYAFSIVAQIGAFIAWFAIVILGRQPKGLQDMTVLGTSYQQRAYAYISLLDEAWPAITQEPASLDAGARPPAVDPPA